LFVLLFLLYSGLELGCGNWISSYVKNLRLEDEEHAAYLATIFWMALTAGRFVGIPIAARVGPVAILAMNILGSAISLTVMLVWPGNSWVVWVGTAGAGFSMASVFPTLMTFAGQSLALTGKITSSFFIGASAGAVIFPWLIGQWFESVGPKVMVYTLAVIIVLMTMVFAGLVLKVPQAARSRR
jgi:FHS family Na+ dependent glucose MFS transporter 1